MMYPYMTLNDDTEITHSEMKPDGRVKVYFETPDDNGGTLPAIFRTTPGKMYPATQFWKWNILSTSFGTMPT